MKSMFGTACSAVFLAVALSAQDAPAGDVATWVPPYYIKECKKTVDLDFDGIGMKDAITSIALQFWVPNTDKVIYQPKYTIEDEDVTFFVDWGKKNNIPVLLCIYNSMKMSDGTSKWDWEGTVRPAISQANRSKFISSVMQEMERHGLDGVDIDFEGQSETARPDSALFLEFSRELADSVHAHGKTVRAASFADKSNGPNFNWWKDMLKIYDGVESMGYKATTAPLEGTTAKYGTYDEKIAKAKEAGNEYASRFMIGFPSDTAIWQGITLKDNLEWVIKNKKITDNTSVGICIWDAALKDSAWRKKETWEMVAQISADVRGKPAVSSSSVAKSSSSVAKSSSSEKIVPSADKAILAGYYPDWGKWNKPKPYKITDVPYEKFTHIMWSFVFPKSDGSLDGDAVEDATDLDQMVTLAHKVGTKVVLSLGGAGQCDNFAPVAKDDSKRAKFVKNLVDFVAKHNLDGLDMDWEYSGGQPSSADTAAYSKLIRDIRTSLPKDKSLSAALPCSKYYGKNFTVSVLNEVLDWFGFMTYDMSGPWDDVSRFDSPLYTSKSEDKATWSWVKTAEYWGGQGVPASKMVFGIPFFGFEFEGTTTYGKAFTEGVSVDYKNIAVRTDLEYGFDDETQEPYAYTSNSFITYETPKSVEIKTQWILDNKYAGAMIWDISEDALEDNSQPLLEAVSKTLYANSPASSSSGEKTFIRRLAETRFELPRHNAAATVYSVIGQKMLILPEQQWNSMEQLKEAIGARLPAGNYIVRLKGSPTCVKITIL